jgi:hypothetical protein
MSKTEKRAQERVRRECLKKTGFEDGDDTLVVYLQEAPKIEAEILEAEIDAQRAELIKLNRIIKCKPRGNSAHFHKKVSHCM